MYRTILIIVFMTTACAAYSQDLKTNVNAYNDSVYNLILKKHTDYLKESRIISDTLFISKESLGFFTPQNNYENVKFIVVSLNDIMDLTKKKGISVTSIQKVRLERTGCTIVISDHSVKYSKHNFHYTLESSTLYHFRFTQELLWKLENVEHLFY